MNEQRIKMLAEWIDEQEPDVFITINVPAAHRALRDMQFYLSFWTRSIERNLLGERSLKRTSYEQRFLWFARRETSAAELPHYHIIGRAPHGRAWRGLTNSGKPISHLGCARVKSALLAACVQTPEPFGRKKSDESDTLHGKSAILFGTMVDVRPYRREHASYLLKGCRFPEAHDKERITDELLRDSGLIILPHLPKRGTSTCQQNEKFETASSPFASRTTNTNTCAATRLPTNGL